MANDVARPFPARGDGWVFQEAGGDIPSGEAANSAVLFDPVRARGEGVAIQPGREGIGDGDEAAAALFGDRGTDFDPVLGDVGLDEPAPLFDADTGKESDGVDGHGLRVVDLGRSEQGLHLRRPHDGDVVVIVIGDEGEILHELAFAPAPRRFRAPSPECTEITAMHGVGFPGDGGLELRSGKLGENGLGVSGEKEPSGKGVGREGFPAQA